MARARAKQAKAANGGAGTTELKCPECGRTFGRAAALGAHRRQAHGVLGASAQSRSRRSGTRRATGSSSAAATARSRTARSPASRARASNGGRRTSVTRSSTIDRDALLQTLFPNGMPARETVIQSVSEWLNEAERLAGMR